MADGRNVIVTGAGNGLGLAIAKRFVELGAKVLMVDKEEVVKTRPGSDGLPQGTAFALVKDLADADSAQVIFQAAKTSLGRVDALINNGAWSFHKPMLQTTAAEFDRVVAINQRAPYFLAQEFLRYVINATPRPP